MQTRVDESQNYDVALKKLEPPPPQKKPNYTVSIYMKFQKIKNYLCDTKSVVAQGGRREEQSSLQK